MSERFEAIEFQFEGRKPRQRFRQNRGSSGELIRSNEREDTVRVSAIRSNEASCGPGKHLEGNFRELRYKANTEQNQSRKKDGTDTIEFVREPENTKDCLSL